LPEPPRRPPPGEYDFWRRTDEGQEVGWDGGGRSSGEGLIAGEQAGEEDAPMGSERRGMGLDDVSFSLLSLEVDEL